MKNDAFTASGGIRAGGSNRLFPAFRHHLSKLCSADEKPQACKLEQSELGQALNGCKGIVEQFASRAQRFAVKVERPEDLWCNHCRCPDDDTMHIEGTARCAADGSTIVSDGLNLAIRDSNLLHNLSTETLRYSSFTRGLHL